ncbi:MAG: outer rane autotransporter barrel domain protein, partial [Firmicutes bacterium]|nr:outer rane autotransporter barrel domain protein [Bacillota bacterium]
FNDNLGATISLRGNESLLGRIGIMALRKMQNKAGQQTNFWVRASYLREFCGANSLDVAGDSAQSNNGRNYYQINAGANMDITRQLSLNGDVSKTFGDEQGYRFSLLLTNAW